MTSEQSTAPSYNTGGIELTASKLHEALLMAGTPELGAPFEDAINETGKVLTDSEAARNV
ncbi:hypothetical protein FJP69_05900 [Stenotrophomonas maltophilia]|nr:hypothetical protein FJP69_05900 [Stenotrophomonas maltophilia]